jgi:hypothetical protein
MPRNRLLASVIAGAFVVSLLMTGAPAAAVGAAAQRAGSPPAPAKLRAIACAALLFNVPNGLDRIVVKAEFLPTGYAGGGEVDFVADWPRAPRTLQVFTIPTYFFGGMFFDTAGNVITEWVAGDRPVVEVFHVENGRATLVFSDGARAGFDFWRDAILVNNAALGKDGSYHSTTTEIWRWNGTAYKLIATVPYKTRLEALARLMHGANE